MCIIMYLMYIKDPRKTENGIRITIVLDDDNIKPLRELQSKIISESEKSISFSRVINRMIKVGLKNYKKKEVQF